MMEIKSAVVKCERENHMGEDIGADHRKEQEL